MPKGHETLKYIQEKEKQYKSYIIKGNREEYIIKYHNMKNKQEELVGNVKSTYKQLTTEDIDYITNLPNELVIDLPNEEKIYVSHKHNEKSEYKVNIFGHYHTQYLFTKDAITHISPGSVGNPVDGFIGSEFAILEIENGTRKVTMQQIKYDISKPCEDIKNSSLMLQEDRWGRLLVKTLETGVDYTMFCINEGIRLATLKGVYTGQMTAIPPYIWDEARKNIGIDKEYEEQ